MKARVKATGEVLEIASYATIPMECCDSFGEPLCFCFDDVEILSEGNDLKESEAPDYWTRLEHQAAIAALGGICGNISYDETTWEDMAEDAIRAAHALVEKIKKKEEK